MSVHSSGKRFKVNPVEIGIFAVVTLIFFNSLYSLFHDRPNIAQGFFARSKAEAARSPAAAGATVTQSLAALGTSTLLCDNAVSNQDTQHLKLRLNGAICGAKTPEEASQLTKTSIVNTTNQFRATVFPDTRGMKFTTDYIPLSEGINAIQLDFTYTGGKVVSRRLDVKRAPASK
ncbi:MAG: hypothetical protein JNL01_15055 [Bdellovibrionales bacterium]|nr:hypothetical protein [Bdellovibrionales bacterium]